MNTVTLSSEDLDVNSWGILGDRVEGRSNPAPDAPARLVVIANLSWPITATPRRFVKPAEASIKRMFIRSAYVSLPGPQNRIARPFVPLAHVTVSASRAFINFLEAEICRSVRERPRTSHPTARIDITLSIPRYAVAIRNTGNLHHDVAVHFHQVSNAVLDREAWGAVHAERSLCFVVAGDDSGWDSLRTGLPGNFRRETVCRPFWDHRTLQEGM